MMTDTIIEVKSLRLTSYQRRILESEKRFTLTEAATKVGKTISHLFWLFQEAHNGNPGNEFWWISPQYSQSEIAFKRLYRKVAQSGKYQINLSKMQIVTPVGTILSFKSADNPSALYGENVHAFVFDEFSRAKEDAWFALRTTITYTKARGKFIGNVVSRNWAWNLARKAESGNDPDFEYFRITAYDAIREGILTQSEVDQARKDLPGRIYKMLYEAEFAEVEGALWSFEVIDRNRVTICPDLIKAAVAIDPAVTATDGSDETGLVWGGMAADGSIYICGNQTGIYTPQIWAGKAISIYETNKLDRIVAEVNNGGDLVETIIRNIDRNVAYEKVWASRGKLLRAEPIAALYEQGRVHHVGYHIGLEDEMTSWIQGSKSPNALDAMVWLVTWLTGLKIYNNDDEGVV